MSNYIYLDWNIFNKIEKMDDLNEEEKQVYSTIEGLIVSEKITTPYSNAHINDLLRGYANNPVYIPQHLNTIKRLTNNLCIVQYWGDTQSTWHYRDVDEFFNSALNEKDRTSDSFLGLMDCDETGLMRKTMEMYRFIPVPSNFKEIYKAAPIFNLMFPQTKSEMNMLALMEDIYNFSNNAKKDYSLYKSLKTYINQSKTKLRQQKDLFKGIDKDLPSYLESDKFWEEYAPKNKTSDNSAYQKITDTYFRIDFKGYKSDARFSNMIDDALHVFYGAHCDYFLTIDDKCHYKAAETYHKLGIMTKALKPNEFVNNLGILKT